MSGLQQSLQQAVGDRFPWLQQEASLQKACSTKVGCTYANMHHASYKAACSAAASSFCWWKRQHCQCRRLLPCCSSVSSLWRSTTLSLLLQDASVVLEAWQRLLLDPSTTLAAGSCLRGHLLSLVSILVEDVAAGKATAAGTDGTAVLTAVLRLLELNPNISRWGQQ